MKNLFMRLSLVSMHQEYKFSDFYENIELVIYSVIGFLVPFVLGHPQLVVGTIVNAMLVLGALNIRGWKLVPIIIFPSIGVYSAAVLFGTVTSSLLLLMPFIWIGNSILVFGIKELQLHRKINPILSLIAMSIAKAGFLFTVAFILVSLGTIPALFLVSMGILQLQTSLFGGSLALIIHQLKKQVVK